MWGDTGRAPPFPGELGANEPGPWSLTFAQGAERPQWAPSESLPGGVAGAE